MGSVFSWCGFICPLPALMLSVYLLIPAFYMTVIYWLYFTIKSCGIKITLIQVPSSMLLIRFPGSTPAFNRTSLPYLYPLVLPYLTSLDIVTPLFPHNFFQVQEIPMLGMQRSLKNKWLFLLMEI